MPDIRAIPISFGYSAVLRAGSRLSRRPIFSGPSNCYGVFGTIVMTGIVIASPANPAGSILAPRVSKGPLGQGAALAGLIISDEVRPGCEYERRGPATLGFSPRTFLVNGISNDLGPTGRRSGVERPGSISEFILRNIIHGFPILDPGHSVPRGLERRARFAHRPPPNASA